MENRREGVLATRRTKVVDHALVVMTPKDAERLLKRNHTENRKLRERHVAELCAAMDAGDFNSEDGQTIVVGADRVLYDGQHRLAAQVRANVPMKWLVVTIDDGETAFKTIDSGLKRGVADFFTKEKNATLFATAALFAYILNETNTPLVTSLKGLYTDRRGSFKPARNLIVAYGEDHADEIRPHVEIGSRMYGATGSFGWKSVYAKFSYLMWLLGDDEKMDEFVDAFCELGCTNATIQQVKMTIVKNYARDERRKPDAPWLMGLLLCAYSHFVRGDGSTTLNGGTRSLKVYDAKLAEWRESRW